jgi:hypothetical protein
MGSWRAFAVDSPTGRFLGFIYARSSLEAKLKLLDLGVEGHIFGHSLPLTFVVNQQRRGVTHRNGLCGEDLVLEA